MPLQSVDHLSADDFNKFIESFDTVVTDCDCVLWLDDVALPGSPEVINQFKLLGKNIVYMTNNSSKTRDQYLEKCRQLGFNTEKDEILATAYLAALYLNKCNFKDKVYTMGPQSVADELQEFGIESFGCGPDLIETDIWTFQEQIKLVENVGAVIVGYDEHISFPKLTKALAYLRNPQCLFIATNNDPTKKTKYPGLKFPGAGCMVDALKTSVGKEPIYVGKPERFMQETILANSKIDANRTLMIGDKPSTDILLGKRCGFKTLMVLSGSTTLEQVQGWKESGDPVTAEMIPDFYSPTLGDLLPRLI